MSTCPTAPPRTRRLLTTGLLASVAGTALTLATPTAAAAAPLADAEKSILLVGTTWEGYVQFPTEDGTLAWSDPVRVFGFCTGWFASEEGHIVTAGHCVDPAEGKADILEQFLVDNAAEDLLPEALANWRVEGQDQGSDPVRTVEVVQPPAVEGSVITTPMTVQVVDFQPPRDGDVAILKANGLSESTPALPVATEPAAIGDPVTAIGFPATVQAVSDVSRIRASFKSGTVSSSQISPDGVAGTEVNADISGGMSGGPTINGSGEVLGVNSFVINGEQRNFNFITDGSALRDYLERQDVPLVSGSAPPATPAPAPAPAPAPEAAPAKAEKSSEIPVWAFVAGGVGVVLLAGMGLLLARRRSPAAPAGPQGPMAYTGQPGPTGPYPQTGQAAPHGFSPSDGQYAPMARPAPPSRPASADQAAALPRQMGSPAVESCDHADNPAGARFCQSCGRQLVS